MEPIRPKSESLRSFVDGSPLMSSRRCIKWRQDAPHDRKRSDGEALFGGTCIVESWLSPILSRKRELTFLSEIRFMEWLG